MPREATCLRAYSYQVVIWDLQPKMRTQRKPTVLEFFTTAIYPSRSYISLQERAELNGNRPLSWQVWKREGKDYLEFSNFNLSTIGGKSYLEKQCTCTDCFYLGLVRITLKV